MSPCGKSHANPRESLLLRTVTEYNRFKPVAPRPKRLGHERIDFLNIKRPVIVSGMGVVLWLDRGAPSAGVQLRQTTAVQSGPAGNRLDSPRHI